LAWGQWGPRIGAHSTYLLPTTYRLKDHNNCSEQQVEAVGA